MRRTLLTLLVTLPFAALLPTSSRAGDEKEVLGKKGSEGLKILLQDERPRARRAAITALEIIGPKGDRVLHGLTMAMEKDKDPEIRREVAQALMDTVRALRLLGCDVTVTGISAAVATTLTETCATLSGIVTARTPQDALARYAGELAEDG